MTLGKRCCGGFLDDVYECFMDQNLAEKFMTGISEDIESFTPLVAQRCALSGWQPKGGGSGGGKASI